MTSRHQPRIPLVLAAALLALTAACGGSGDTDTDTEGSDGATSNGALRAETSDLGEILVDRGGRTVYVFAKDPSGASSCTGDCASNWPPVKAPTPVPSSLPGVTGALGSTERADGTTQLTVADHPVYTFVGDTEPGQTNGHGRMLDGGLWTAVSPDGSPVPDQGSSTEPSDDSGGGYGY